MRLQAVKTQNPIFYYQDLFYDYLFRFEKLAGFFEYDYRDLESYQARAAYLESTFPKKSRMQSSDILLRYNQRLGCSEKTVENIQKIKNKSCAAVIGGQQPGLLTGPLFLIYKVITVIRTAKALQGMLDIDVVPMFWNASDDSDFLQVSSISILSQTLKTYQIKKMPGHENVLFAKIPLSQAVLEEMIGFLEESLHPSDFKKEIIDFIQGCCRDEHGLTIALLFSKICSRLFSEYGIVMVDPNMEGCKELSSGIIRFETGQSSQISRTANAAGSLLKEYGYHAQLNAMEQVLNVFLNEKGARTKIHFSKSGYQVGKDLLALEELQSLFVRRIQDLSFNVILRPLFQDSILPVLCNVCGPSEVSYFAQLKGVYRLWGRKMPVIIPRLGATLVEKKTRKSMEVLGLDYDRMHRHPDAQADEAVREKAAFDIGSSVDALRLHLNRELKGFENRLLTQYNTIGSTFDRIKRNLNKEIDVLEKKLWAEQKKQDKELMDAVEKIFLNIFPGGDLQERVVNVFSYINKYGFGFLDALASQAEPFDFYHKMIEFE